MSSNLFYLASFDVPRSYKSSNCRIFRQLRPWWSTSWDGSSAIYSSVMVPSPKKSGSCGWFSLPPMKNVTPLVASPVAFQQWLPPGLSSKGLRRLEFSHSANFQRSPTPHPTGLFLISQQKSGFNRHQSKCVRNYVYCMILYYICVWKIQYMYLWSNLELLKMKLEDKRRSQRFSRHPFVNNWLSRHGTRAATESTSQCGSSKAEGFVVEIR